MTVSRAKPRLPTIVREGFWVGSGQVATALATLLGLKILTTLLPPDAYGEFALLLGLAALSSGFFCGPLLQSLIRFYPEAAKENAISALRRLASRYLTRSTAAAVVFLLLVGLFWIARPSSRTSFAAFVMVTAFLAADVLRLFESNLLNASRRQAEYSFRNVADAWARPAVAVLAIVVLGPSPVSVLAGYAAGSALVALVLRHRTVRGDESAPTRTGDPWAENARRPFLAYALPLAPMAVLTWILNLSDRYILAGVSGTAAAGLYAAAYGLGSYPFLVVNGFVLTTLRPVLYDAVARGEHSKERRILWVWLCAVVGVSGAGVALYAVLAKWVTRLLLGPDYQGASALLPWIAGAYALQSVQQTFEIMMYAHGQTRRLVALQAVAAASGLLFYAILIPRFGATGAAAGTLGAFVVTCFTSFVLAGAPSRLRWRNHPDRVA